MQPLGGRVFDIFVTPKSVPPDKPTPPPLSPRPRWQQRLLSAWTRRGPLACALWPAAAAYQWVWMARRVWLHTMAPAPTRLRVPVLVVGNVVAGGSGKTPVVMALVQGLSALGIRVGVVSRGYGRSQRGVQAVHPNSPASAVGDEPLLIRQRCAVPVFVAEARVLAAQALLAAHPQTQLIVSDDGLQHAALARDLELGVFDDRGVGNGWLLPAGPLREPWPRRLDACLQTRAGIPCAHGFVVQRSLGAQARRADGQTLDLATLAQRAVPCVALAGIARPEVFFAALRERGLDLRHGIALPDHAPLDDFDASLWPDTPVLCTEKDAVKLWPRHPQVWAVPLICTLPESFWHWLGPQLARLGLPAAHQTSSPTPRVHPS